MFGLHQTLWNALSSLLFKSKDCEEKANDMIEDMDKSWKERQALNRIWRDEAQKFHLFWWNQLEKLRIERIRERGLESK